MAQNNEQMTVGEESHVVNGEWETLKTSRVDVEKIEEIEVTFKFFSFHRIQAIGSLFVLVAISLLPLFLLGGSLGKFPIFEVPWFLTIRKHGSGYWWCGCQDMACVGPFPWFGRRRSVRGRGI